MRFLHTGDWQLGMTRHFLAPEAQARFDQARIDAVTRMAGLAAEHDAAFVVVAGDIFETNQPEPRTIGRALDALAAFTVPVYLLPGNHDPDDPGSVYRSATFRSGCPAGVEVLSDHDPRHPVADVEVVGAPWPSKHPIRDLTAELCRAQPADGRPRVVVGHGAVDAVVGDHDLPGLIRLADVEAAVTAGQVRYVALGDRHSTLAVGDTGRIWYAGAPEPTGYREDDPGNVLLVDLAADPPEVTRLPVGRWRFVTLTRAVDGDEDIDRLLADLDALPDRARTIVKVKVDGVLSLTQAARLEAGLEARSEVLGALEHPERHTDIVIAPTDADLDALPLVGYAATARDRLRARAAGEGDDGRVATDALGLLVRLAAEVSA